MRLQRSSIGMLNVVCFGDLIKLLWWSGDGMNLYVKRLERGRFVTARLRSSGRRELVGEQSFATPPAPVGGRAGRSTTIPDASGPGTAR
jgi:hypothetical protein